ncbi:MAG TPA: hypothetical protein VMU84_05240 [Thermoanaerobaculia bacterium]|nr:hypothetical protein [Thermoanaerobaculia bacterium]
MPIILPNDLTTQEIRVLQEFRRLNTETLGLAAIKAIKHPFGGGDAPAGLVSKGFVTTDAPGENFTLATKGKDFLAIDAKPMNEDASGSGDEPAE